MSANRNMALLALAIVPIVATCGIGRITLFDVDEAVFAQATKEMVASGDWITPTYNGVARYDKPILFYWLMAASYSSFGVNEFAARLPSALAGSLMSIFLFLFVRRIIGQAQAWYSLMAVSLNSYYVVYSRSAVTDMVLSLCIAMSLMSFYLAEHGNRRFILGFYGFSALAFLTKGLVGIAFPFGIAAIYLFVRGGPGALRGMLDLRAALLFIAIGLPWYAVQFAIGGEEFFQQFFVKHHFRRYTEVISSHWGPAYYYLIALIVGFSPWIAFVPGGIKVALGEKGGLRLFALIWSVSVVVFFTLSRTKLPNYILPALPAMAILSAAGMAEAGGWWRRGAWLAIAIGSLLSAAAICVGWFMLGRNGIDSTAWAVCACVILIAMSGIGFCAAYGAREMCASLAVLDLVLLGTLLVGAVPVASGKLQGALHGFSLYAGEKAGGDDRIICYGINNPSIAFYSGRYLANIGGREALAAHLGKSRDRQAISKARDAGDLKDAGFRLVKEEGGYALLERE